MRRGTAGAWGVGLWALVLGGCNPSLVTEEDPLFQAAFREEVRGDTSGRVEHAYFLGTPLSGPQWRNPNAFGKDLQTEDAVLPAGTPVVVIGLERVRATDWRRESAVELGATGWIYRVEFHTEAPVCASGCRTHWFFPGDEAFLERFHEVFRESDPLADLEPGTRALVQRHKVASWFDDRLTRLSLGRPANQVEVGPDATWVYERQACQAGRLQAIPSLKLWLEGGEVTGYERLSATDFRYIEREPQDPYTGLCGMAARAPDLVDDREWPRPGLTCDPAYKFRNASLDRQLKAADAVEAWR